MADDGPSLPSNYVTILHLKERWLKQQQQSNPNLHESASQPTLKPEIDPAPKIPNQSVHRGNNLPPLVNQTNPDVNLHDSASKSPNESVHRNTNRNRMVNQVKSEVKVHDSASETLTQVADNHPVVEDLKVNTDQSNSKLSTSKSSFRRRNPRFVTNRIPTGGSTKPSETEPVPEKKQLPKPEIVPENKQPSKRESVAEKKQLPEKKQHRYKGGRRKGNRKQEVRESKVKTPPFAQNDSGGGVEAVAGAVKEMRVTDVKQRTNRKWSYGRFKEGGAKTHPVGVKTTTVWVRKGEHVQN